MIQKQNYFECVVYIISQLCLETLLNLIFVTIKNYCRVKNSMNFLPSQTTYHQKLRVQEDVCCENIKSI